MNAAFVALGSAAALAASVAHAELTLTADALTAGFTLSTFVSGYDFGGGYGPLSQGIASNGNVITGSSGDGKIYVFRDVDGQTLAGAIGSQSYAC